MNIFIETKRSCESVYLTNRASSREDSFAAVAIPSRSRAPPRNRPTRQSLFFNPPDPPALAPANFGFPVVNGTYLCLIMCFTCCFIVMKNNMMKYINKIGQNTGMSNIGINVIANAVPIDFKLIHQNLNSGNRRTNGLNSCSLLVGSDGPSSPSFDARSDSGSFRGLRNPINRFRL